MFYSLSWGCFTHSISLSQSVQVNFIPVIKVSVCSYIFFFFFVQGAGLPRRSGSTERLGRVLGYGSHSAIVGRKPES